MTPRARMPSLSLRPRPSMPSPNPSTIASRPSQASPRCLAPPTFSPLPSPLIAGAERTSYFNFSTQAVAAPPSSTAPSASASVAAAAVYEFYGKGIETRRVGGATTATTTSNAFALTGVAAQLPPRGDDVPVSHRRQTSEEVEHSTPIAIRGRAATQERTPAALSARGEIEGGYFSAWNEHAGATPANTRKDSGTSGVEDLFHRQPPSDTSTSTISPATSSTTPTALKDLRLPARSKTHPRPHRPSHPAFPPTMMVAQGKYHPSNYRNPSLPTSNTSTATTSTTASTTSTSAPSTSTAATSTTSFSSSSVTTSSASPSRATEANTRALLLQYQRDMVEAAARAAQLPLARSQSPVSPRLGPLGSPGPVTPWELEGGEGGWLDREKRA